MALTVLKTNVGTVIGTERGIFSAKLLQSEVGQYEGFDIVFVTPLTLKAGDHHCFKAEITGPPSLYGEDG